jgi:hypothetical protein
LDAGQFATLLLRLPRLLFLLAAFSKHRIIPVEVAGLNGLQGLFAMGFLSGALLDFQFAQEGLFHFLLLAIDLLDGLIGLWVLRVPVFYLIDVLLR